MPTPTVEPEDPEVDEFGWLAFLMDRSSEQPDKPCEMIVSLTQSGFKDFAVGVPKGSKLR